MPRLLQGFSINGKTTIATKDPFMQGIIGQRIGLSHRDKRLANIMYKCIGESGATLLYLSDSQGTRV